MQRTDDLARLAIDNTPATLEPESVTFSADSRFADITLQENSGVLRLDILAVQLTPFGTGNTTHFADLTVDGNYVPIESLLAFREPDGIVVYSTGRFFVTADEGDTRDVSGSTRPARRTHAERVRRSDRRVPERYGRSVGRRGGCGMARPRQSEQSRRV